MGLLDELFGGGSGSPYLAQAAPPVSGPPAAPPPPPPGFSGGLMGGAPTGYDYAGAAMGALGQSLLSSPGDNWLQGLNPAMKKAVSGMNGPDQTLWRALRAAGLSDEEIQRYAADPPAAYRFLSQQSASSGGAAAPSGMLSSGSLTAPSAGPAPVPSPFSFPT